MFISGHHLGPDHSPQASPATVEGSGVGVHNEGLAKDLGGHKHVVDDFPAASRGHDGPPVVVLQGRGQLLGLVLLLGLLAVEVLCHCCPITAWRAFLPPPMSAPARFFAP